MRKWGHYIKHSGFSQVPYNRWGRSFLNHGTSPSAQFKAIPPPGASLLPSSRVKRPLPVPDLHTCWSTVLTPVLCTAQILGQAFHLHNLSSSQQSLRQVQSWSLFYKCVHGDSSKFRNRPTISQLMSSKAPPHRALESCLLQWAGNLHSSPFLGFNTCQKGREFISFGHTGSPALRLVQGCLVDVCWMNEVSSGAQIPNV